MEKEKDKEKENEISNQKRSHLVANLPVIDISSLFDQINEGSVMRGKEREREREEVVCRLVEACKRYGMFKVSGHEVSKLPEVLKASVALFQLNQNIKESVQFDTVYKSKLPEAANEEEEEKEKKEQEDEDDDEKKLNRIRKKGKEGFTRGYIPIFGESGRKEFRELKEAFSYGYTWPNEDLKGNACKDIDMNVGNIYSNPLQGENIWPPMQGNNSFRSSDNLEEGDKIRSVAGEGEIVAHDPEYKCDSEVKFELKNLKDNNSQCYFSKESKSILIKFFDEMARASHIISYTLLYAAYKSKSKLSQESGMKQAQQKFNLTQHDPFIHQKVANLLKEGDTISLMRAFHYFSPSKLQEDENQVEDQNEDQDYRNYHKHTQDNVDTENNQESENNRETEDIQEKEKEIIGSSSHTDWGLLTLILQDHIGGLQLYDEEANEYLNVPGDEGRGYLICNAGDYMSLLSDFDYTSPIHRVLPPPPQMERYSMVFFYYPNYDTPFDLQQKQQPVPLSLLEETKIETERSAGQRQGEKQEQVQDYPDISAKRKGEERKEKRERGRRGSRGQGMILDSNISSYHQQKGERKHKLSNHIGFNTLLDITSNGDVKDKEESHTHVSECMSFGQYIQKKWKGVNTMG